MFCSTCLENYKNLFGNIKLIEESVLTIIIFYLSLVSIALLSIHALAWLKFLPFYFLSLSAAVDCGSLLNLDNAQVEQS